MPQQCRFCKRNLGRDWRYGCNCRNRCEKEGCYSSKEEGEKFCWSHRVRCLAKDCGESPNSESDPYCSSHARECQSFPDYCDKRISSFDNYCWMHCCRQTNCKEKRHSGDYCSSHSKRCKECRQYASGSRGEYCLSHEKKCQYCLNRISNDKSRCWPCYRQCQTCRVLIDPKSINDYCNFHQGNCEYCQIKGLPTGEGFCSEHKNECSFSICKTRIKTEHCELHPPQEQTRLYRLKWEEEERKTSGLQTQLTAVNNQLTDAYVKINRAQTNLGIDDLDVLATELQNSAGVIWNLAKWKQELEIERESARNMDNFYRQQFPFKVDLDHIRNELSRQVLEINQEKRQKEQEINDLKKIIETFEKFTIQTKDNFLAEKIENRQSQLEQLKVNARNRLNGELPEILEDILEAQKVFVQSNNDLTLGQLRRFKQRLLNSGQIGQDELQEICQVQAELSFLELKQQREKEFQTQVEIDRN